MTLTANDKTADDFARFHKLFSFHLGVAVALAWATSLFAAAYAPWVRNIRALIDPLDATQVESTWAFLFGMPIILSTAWLMIVFGEGILREMRVFKNQAIEFGIAGAVAFTLFYLSIDRAVAALLLGF
jgi:hypothetical protein